MKRTSRWSWTSQVLLAVVAIGVVLAAPLAATNHTTNDAVVISGARSLSDQVAVSYSELDRRRSTDVHLLAFNDLHGNLEAGGLNIYGKFAGGAAYLAKAVKDRQALYRGRQATIFAGDNIGASPLANGLFFESP
jgi:5'-nucleotidase